MEACHTQATLQQRNCIKSSIFFIYLFFLAHQQGLLATSCFALHWHYLLFDAQCDAFLLIPAMIHTLTAIIASNANLQ